MSHTWSHEEEAERLARRFEGVNQAKFAREHGVPGGPSMVSQHIKGHRPINMDSALAYAKGFGVPIAEVSPRLASQVAAASETLSAHEPSYKYLAQTVISKTSSATLAQSIASLRASLKPHSPTRRAIIGNLLGQLAQTPDDAEVATELAALMAPTADASVGRPAPAQEPTPAQDDEPIEEWKLNAAALIEKWGNKRELEAIGRFLVALEGMGNHLARRTPEAKKLPTNVT